MGSFYDLTFPISGDGLSIDKLPKVKNPKFIIYSRPDQLFPDFQKGYSAFGMNNGSFSFGDLIEYILKKTGPVHALISSWVLNAKAAEKITAYLNYKEFLSIRFLLDRVFASTRPEIYKFIIKQFGENCIRTANTHIKVCVLYNDEWGVVIESSANLNTNKRLEYFRITDCEKLSEFFIKFFDNIFNILTPKADPIKAGSRKGTSLDDLSCLPDSLKTDFSSPKKINAKFKLPWD